MRSLSTFCGEGPGAAANSWFLPFLVPFSFAGIARVRLAVGFSALGSPPSPLAPLMLRLLGVIDGVDVSASPSPPKVGAAARLGRPVSVTAI